MISNAADHTAGQPTPKLTPDFSHRLNSPLEGTEFYLDSIETIVLRSIAMLNVTCGVIQNDFDPKELYWVLNAVTLEMGDILALIEANGAVDRNQRT